MSFRRFVYLVTDDPKSHTYLLRRIDIKRFFLPKRQRDRLTSPPPLEDGQLRAPNMRFGPPFVNGGMNFFLHGGTNGSRDEKVVVADQAGNGLTYDTVLRSLRPLNGMIRPKFAPVSVNVGKNLYIMDALFTPSIGRGDCFDGIIYYDQGFARRRDWYTYSLPPPPYADTYRNDPDPAHVISYAAVAGGGDGGGSEIWFSKDSVGTHAYDVATGAWRKAGDWVLPFYGHVQHVPDHGLWFGVSNPYGEDTILCAADLAVTPPTARLVWEDQAPPGWISVSSHLVHLGRSMFCHARFFDIRRPDVGCLSFVVVTGLVVERRHEEAGGDELVVVKHRSVRYNVSYNCLKWVL